MTSPLLLTFQRNVPWREYFPECLPLWKEHYQEMAMGAQESPTYPMSPSIHDFAALDAAGALSILTARLNGVMCGYYLAVVRLHPHYSILCGFEDSYFLSRRARKGRAGLKLLLEAEEMIRQRGAKELFVQENLKTPTGRLWERLGYLHTHNTYRKTL